MSEYNNIPKIRFKGFTDVWEQRKLGEKYKFQYGEYNNNPDNGGIYPIYGANGIIGGYTKFNAEDSIIIGHMGEYAGSVLWGEGKHFVTYNGTISSPKDTSINSKFGYYMLLHKNINKICGGSGLPFLSYEQLNKIDVDYPLEKEEQNKISILFKNIDNLITLHQRKCDKLINIKKSMLEKMFPKNSSNIPEIRFKGFTDVWEQRKLGEIGNTFTGLSGKTKEDFGHGEAKFVTYMNVFSNPIAQFNKTEPIEIDNKQNQVEYGDVFFTTSSETPDEVGMSSVWLENKGNIYLNSFCFGFRPFVKNDPYYMAYMLRSKNFRKNMTLLAQGISRYNISKNGVMNIDIQLPINQEQEKIGKLFYEIDNLITLHQRKVEKLNNIKKSMLEKMFV